MLLDTFNDHRKAYELDFNPLGIQQDGIWQDPIFNEDFNPDFVLESKGTLTGDGYTVEVAVPFKSLRYEAGKNKLWGDGSRVVASRAGSQHLRHLFSRLLTTSGTFGEA